MDARPSIAVLGAGRAGCSLYEKLQQKNYLPVLLWTRSDATAAAARAAGFAATSGPLRPVAADLVLLAVSDSAVAPLAAELAARSLVSPASVVAHLAGALDLSPLAPLREQGISTGSLHPLVSMATRHAPLAGYTAAVEGADERAERVLAQAAADAGLAVVRPHGSRALYHAAACIAGNYPQVLLEAGVRLFADCGVAEADARRALGALLESAAANARALGPAGLTGPVARGDKAVVGAHLQALAGTDPDIEALYRAAGVMATKTAVRPEARPIASLLRKSRRRR